MGLARRHQTLPGQTEPPLCVRPRSLTGEQVFPHQVTVSVYNGSDRNGLAGRTMELLEDRGFNRGATRQRAGQRRGSAAQIWSDAAPQCPPSGWSRGSTGAEVVRRRGLGLGVMVVVGDEFKDSSRGKKAVVTAVDADHLQPTGEPVAAVPLRLGPQPLGQPPALGDLAQPLLGRLAELARGDDEQVVAVAQDRAPLGHQVSPSRITRATDAPVGSRSSPTSTPCIRELG